MSWNETLVYTLYSIHQFIKIAGSFFPMHQTFLHIALHVTQIIETWSCDIHFQIMIISSHTTTLNIMMHNLLHHKLINVTT